MIPTWKFAMTIDHICRINELISLILERISQ